jgi:hypothetical protein
MFWVIRSSLGLVEVQAIVVASSARVVNFVAIVAALLFFWFIFSFLYWLVVVWLLVSWFGLAR